jgi:hypothetical protein
MNEYQELGCGVWKLFSGYVVAVCFESCSRCSVICLAFTVLYLMFLCLKIILFVLSLLVLKIFSSVLLVCLLLSINIDWSLCSFENELKINIRYVPTE